MEKFITMLKLPSEVVLAIGIVLAVMLLILVILIIVSLIKTNSVKSKYKDRKPKNEGFGSTTKKVDKPKKVEPTKVEQAPNQISEETPQEFFEDEVPDFFEEENKVMRCPQCENELNKFVKNETGENIAVLCYTCKKKYRKDYFDYLSNYVKCNKCGHLMFMNKENTSYICRKCGAKCDN